jgi:hemolysin
MKKVFGILLVGLLSMSLEAHNKDMSRKVKKPLNVKQSVSVGNINQNNNYQNEDFPEQKMIGMANPASVYCVEQGGESIIKQDKDGSEYGICKFKDGKEVDEWEFYRKNHDLTEKGVPEINKK